MAIRFMQCLILLAIASTLLVSASSDEPFIVAHKKASLKRIKSGVERVFVSFDIYNQGSATAYDVTLIDETWPQAEFSVVSGNTSVSWEKLDAGSVVSHAFELETKVKGVFSGAPAIISYRIPTKAAPMVAYTSPLLPLDILAEKTPEKPLALVKRLLAKYGSLVSVIIVIVVFIYLLASPSKSSGPKGSKKRH